MADFESRHSVRPSGEEAEKLAARLARKPDMKRLESSRSKSRLDNLRADEATEVVESLSEADKKAIAAELARDVLNDEAKKAAVTEASTRMPSDIAAEAIRAAAEAVDSASPENKKAVAKEAMESLPSTERQELAEQLRPSQDVTNEVWLTVVTTFRWVLWGATIGLIAIIGLAAFREVDPALVQIMLTVVTTTAGILAGFSLGEAVGTTEDILWSQIPKPFTYVLWAATVGLIAAIGVALFRKVDVVLIQIMLTMFTTVAGIVAGSITGQALAASTRKEEATEAVSGASQKVAEAATQAATQAARQAATETVTRAADQEPPEEEPPEGR